MKNKKILIAGGAGFIGSHLCDYYISRGSSVLCLDNLVTGARINLEHLLSSPLFSFVQADIISLEGVPLDNDFDMVFHLASPASPPDYLRLPIDTLKVNSRGTENMLELARRCNAKFLFTSTSEVYGDPLIPIQDEEYWGNVNPIGPRSVYDEAKRYGEAIVMAYHREYQVDTRIIRIFNTYGPRMRLQDGRVIPNFIAQIMEGKPMTIYGDGEQTRSFCYISDLIAGISRMMEIEYHLPVNLGNSDEFTIMELARLIQQIFEKETGLEFLPPLEDDPRRRRPDISKAKELLGWEPCVSLKKGLLKTIEYFAQTAK